MLSTVKSRSSSLYATVIAYKSEKGESERPYISVEDSNELTGRWNEKNISSGRGADWAITSDKRAAPSAPMLWIQICVVFLITCRHRRQGLKPKKDQDNRDPLFSSSLSSFSCAGSSCFLAFELWWCSYVSLSSLTQTPLKDKKYNNN